ncbi:kinase-like domain-containing protein [Mycena latifolia]|nr:kinase-like domain-containing protein [Mycena latifolia]
MDTTQWIKGALIGSGRFGDVYLGMDGGNGLLMAVRQVELPITAADDEQRNRRQMLLQACEREVALLKTLEHEHIVQYLYSSQDAQHANFFFEYIPGGAANSLLGRYGAFEEHLAKNFGRQILHGLVYLHDRGIVHGGLRCAHILVDNRGTVKLCALREPEAVDLTNPIESIFWTAPEVIQGAQQWTIKSDIWSLGCTLVEMLSAGSPYPQLTPLQFVSEIETARPSIPADLSSYAEEFLRQTFKLYSERPSAAELLEHPWMRASARQASNGTV